MTTCLECHHKCKARCCTTIAFYGLKKRWRRGETVRLSVENITPDMEWYYKLHRVHYHNGVLSFILLDHEWDNKILLVNKKCDYLQDDLTCKGHPDDKPNVCKELNETTAQEKRMYITKGCMYEQQNK